MNSSTVGAAPWYTNPVQIAQVTAFITASIAFAPGIAGKLGITAANAPGAVNYAFGAVAMLATIFGVIKKAYSAINPLTLTAAGAAAHPATAAALAAGNASPATKAAVVATTNSKTGGFATANMLAIVAVLSMVGCAALGLQPVTNGAGTLEYAYSGVASSYTELAQLATAGTISKPAAMKAYTAITAVKSTLDVAASAATSSAPVAVNVITTATATLASIAAYLTCNQQTPGSITCQL